MIPHDRLFKELLTIFLYEFLELFLPELASSVERDSIEFLDKEMFTELGEGERREADLVARARFKGEDSFFLIHAEAQADGKGISLFPRRMLRYYSILLERYDLPIYPIALLSYPNPRREAPTSYSVKFPDFEPLSFRYRAVQLNRMKWRDYVRRPNPVAAALMSRMHIRKRERPAVKVACLRLLAGLNLDPARTMFISSFVDQYLRLDSEEEKRFNKEVEEMSVKDREAVLELTTSWEERGRRQGPERGLERGLEQGLRQGQQRGLEMGRRQTILEILQHRFGAAAEDLLPQLERLGTPELIALVSHVYVDSLEDLRARIQKLH